MENTFFGRIWNMTISDMGAASGIMLHSPLRLTFDITKTETPNGNVAKFMLNNLSEETRGGIKKGMLVVLNVGYFEAHNTDMIWSGEITNVSHDVTKPEVVTTIDCIESYLSYKTKRLQKSWSKGTPKSQILKDAISAAGFAHGSTVVLTENTTHKIAFNGFAVDLIQKICDVEKLRWSIQNGNIKITRIGSVDGTETVKTVLIGSPRKVFKRQTGQEQADFEGWEIDCLILARAAVGGTVTFTSAEAPEGASIQVAEVKHSGDNFGDKWTSTIKGRSILNGSVLVK